ncbi:amino acid adenylation domain-containing protein, partial [Flavobacterium sp. LS1R47]
LDSYYQELINNKTVKIKEDTAYIQTQEYIGRYKNDVDRYWKSALSEVEGTNDISALLSHPIDFSSYKQVEVSANSSFEIKGELYNQLKAFTQKEGITINVMIQFIWHKLLHVYSNSQKSIVGTTISGRELPIDGIEQSVGLYINTLPLIIDWNNQGTVLDQLHQIQKKIIEMNTHSFADLAKLQKEGERLFQSLFIFENYPVPEGDDDQERSSVSLRDFIEKVDYPLNIMAFEQGELLTIKFNYDGNYLTQSKAKEHLATLVHILNQVLSNPNILHNEISLLNSEDYQEIVYNWNATDKAYPKDKTIQELFENQIKKTPNNVALVYQGESLTYNQLNEKSNQLAHHIRALYKAKTQKELTPDTLIALCLERSLEMVIGILGVLKAGGAYVPIDPSLPQERIDYVLEDTQTELVLSQRHLNEKAYATLPDEKVIYIDLSEELYKTQAKTNLPQQSQSSDLAYVIYTSGTTGKPKGVMVEHKAFTQFIYNFNDTLKDRGNSFERNVLSLTNYVFDIFGLEYALPLIFGNKITLSTIHDVKEENLLEQQIIQQTPSALLYLVNQYPDKLSKSVCLVGGEALPSSIAEKLIGAFEKVINVYGPAETVIWSSSFEVKDSEKPYIGSPLFNEQMYILDQALNPVPTGVIGELYIGGAGLSRGYLNLPELTAERFINNPFATESDKAKGYTKLYKTGDLVHWLADGNIEYLGRNDDQVKIRGYRIELGEIEHAMSQIDGINQVCVLAKERKTETATTKYLVGYYVSDYDMTSIDIQNRLLEVLPDYMIPTALVAMESFPLTINGKLDKRALPDPEFTSSEVDYVAPTTEIEAAVCEIWMVLLGLDRVGITDEFFKIGGNSILALQASHRMSQFLKCNVKVADIFKYKAIKTLLESFALAEAGIEGDEWEF